MRPLTYRTPKPLLPLLDRPMVMHIISSLPKEVDTVVLAVSYMKEALERYFRENDCGRKVVLVNEEEPLGTGGAIRNVRDHLDDEFLCFNGDIVSSLDLKEFIKFHRSKGGMGTLALWRVPDPTAFGVVALEGDRITHFQEKPAPGSAISDLINAGIYVFRPDILDRIPDGKVSLERDVFPHILDHGLYGRTFSGYWVDCGTPESYLRAQSELLEHGMDLNRPTRQEGATVLGNNYLDGTELKGCQVGPHVCALAGSAIMEGSTVERSVLMEGARVGKECQVRNCLLGPGARIEDGRTICDEVLVSTSPAGVLH